MSLSSFSIKRPVFSWVLMFSLIFFGSLSFFSLGINENPDIDFPSISIRYSYPGATPEVIEKDVIEPVESVLVSMQGIENMTSTAKRGSARIQLEFSIDKDIDFALQEVQSLLGRAGRQLPDSLETPTVIKSNTADDPIMYLNLRSSQITDRDLMILFRDKVRDRLSTVVGVSEIRAFGYHEPMLRIDLLPEKMTNYQLTADDILLSLQREHSELPAGSFEKGDREETIRLMGEATTVAEFANMPISRRGGSPNFIPLKLSDVANIYEGVENLRRISRFNGEKALGMAVQKQRGVNAAATADLVKERIVEINTELPNGVELGVNFDRTQFIRESVDELVFSLLLSAILTSLVCWLFLGSWSATINILLAIPTSIVGSFIFLKLFGFTLNTFSLLGLTLAIGVVVDDAIIMLENIVRYMQKGYDRVNAAFKGAREITFAVLATTVALISIFSPISFLNTIEGKFFFEFAITISVAVALSSLEALTLAPMRCSQFLRLEERRTSWGKAFDRGVASLQVTYTSLLNKALGAPKKVIVISVLFFLVALSIVKLIPTEFAPAQDRGVLFAVFLAPAGSSLEYTQRKVIEFENIVKDIDGVAKQFMAVGGFGDGGESNRGNGVIILDDFAERSKDQFEIATELREKIKSIEGIRIFVRDRFGGPLGGRRGSPIEFIITGPDPIKQKELFRSLKAKMEETGKIVGVRSDDALVLPEVHIIPDRKKANERGVEVSAIANAVNTSLGGVTAVQYTQGSRRFDVFVQYASSARESADALSGISVRNNRGEVIPLSELTVTKITSGPQSVYRENRTRGLRVDANLAEGASQGEMVKVIRAIADELMPKDYSIRFESTPDDKLLETLLVMLLGLLVAYLVLSIQFNSFMDPLIVFLAIPFGLIGSLIGLLVGGQSLNIYSAIGILLTMGIVKKNSILLVEFTNQLRDSGKSLKDSISEACPTRLRPILMTSFATLAAAIPPALALGPGSETRIPMALTVIGGVLLSSLVTLFVVPCAHLLIAPKRLRIPDEQDQPG